jgi:hypothetical protein
MLVGGAIVQAGLFVWQLQSDLSSQKSNGLPLCDANLKLPTRRAGSEEAILFGHPYFSCVRPS